MVMVVAPQLAFAAGRGSAPTYELSRLLVVLPLISIVAMTISTRWWVATLITAAQISLIFTNLAVYDTPRVLAVGMVVSTMMVAGLAWWLAFATDGRRAASPIMAGVLLVAATALFGLFDIEVAVAFSNAAFVVLILSGLILSRIDPRLTTAATIFAALFVASTFPVALGNDDSGWNYWAPIGLSVLFLSVMVAASWSGIRRLASA
jgi:hypothetical protein